MCQRERLHDACIKSTVALLYRYPHICTARSIFLKIKVLLFDNALMFTHLPENDVHILFFIQAKLNLVILGKFFIMLFVSVYSRRYVLSYQTYFLFRLCKEHTEESEVTRLKPKCKLLPPLSTADTILSNLSHYVKNGPYYKKRDRLVGATADELLEQIEKNKNSVVNPFRKLISYLQFCTNSNDILLVTSYFYS